jgi:membrane-associated PAP2 superfamily phosphatase
MFVILFHRCHPSYLVALLVLCMFGVLGIFASNGRVFAHAIYVLLALYLFCSLLTHLSAFLTYSCAVGALHVWRP